MTEFGQRRVGSVRIVIDAFGTAMTDEYQLHPRERSLGG